jgi:thiamine-monophosphate kinase
MRINQLGEFGLIAEISALVKERSAAKSDAWRDLLIGIGDDTAAWHSPGGIELMTTDVLAEDVHFDLNYTGWEELGWKALAVNISDINSMGGRPRYALVSLAIPGRRDSDDVLKLYAGMLEIANLYGVALAGGNISSSDKIVINIALTGLAGGDLLTRSAARPGDLVGVFGWPGLSAAGHRTLNEYIAMDEAAARLFRQAHLRPSHDFTNGPALSALEVKAAIDISDGLVSDLGHICRASGAAAVLHADKIPIHPMLAKYFTDSALKLALSGGEDYLLLFTAPPEVMDRVLRTFDPAPVVIGEITGGGKSIVTLLNGSGQPVALDSGGWDHYNHAG